MAAMLVLVESYGAKLNLTCSSNQDPKKCKSFCLYFVGPRPPRKIKYPAPLLLNGVVLPWRTSAVHLGHTLHQDLTFQADAAQRRAGFISSSLEVREQFSFAQPAQILKAVRMLSCHAYGSVLWRLDSGEADSFFRAYSSCVRRVYRLPINTFTYLVEGHPTQGLAPLRNLVMGRYPAFYQKMAWSPCREVAVMAQVVAGDRRTITAGNLAQVSALTRMNCATAEWLELRAALPVSEVPEKESWRLGLLDYLMVERAGLEWWL